MTSLQWVPLVVSGIASLVAALLAYVVKQRDGQIDELKQGHSKQDTEIDVLRDKVHAQEVQITKLAGHAEAWQIVHTDLKDLGQRMVTREEFATWRETLGRELREIKDLVRPSRYRSQTPSGTMQEQKR